jgi:hypothetical protein
MFSVEDASDLVGEALRSDLVGEALRCSRLRRTSTPGDDVCERSAAASASVKPDVCVSSRASVTGVAHVSSTASPGGRYSFTSTSNSIVSSCHRVCSASRSCLLGG